MTLSHPTDIKMSINYINCLLRRYYSVLGLFELCYNKALRSKKKKKHENVMAEDWPQMYFLGSFMILNSETK